MDRHGFVLEHRSSLRRTRRHAVRPSASSNRTPADFRLALAAGVSASPSSATSRPPPLSPKSSTYSQPPAVHTTCRTSSLPCPGLPKSAGLRAGWRARVGSRSRLRRGVWRRRCCWGCMGCRMKTLRVSRTRCAVERSSPRGDFTDFRFSRRPLSSTPASSCVHSLHSHLSPALTR